MQLWTKWSLGTSLPAWPPEPTFWGLPRSLWIFLVLNEARGLITVWLILPWLQR